MIQIARILAPALTQRLQVRFHLIARNTQKRAHNASRSALKGRSFSCAVRRFSRKGFSPGGFV